MGGPTRTAHLLVVAIDVTVGGRDEQEELNMTTERKVVIILATVNTVLLLWVAYVSLELHQFFQALQEFGG